MVELYTHLGHTFRTVAQLLCRSWRMKLLSVTDWSQDKLEWVLNLYYTLILWPLTSVSPVCALSEIHGQNTFIHTRALQLWSPTWPRYCPHHHMHVHTPPHPRLSPYPLHPPLNIQSSDVCVHMYNTCILYSHMITRPFISCSCQCSCQCCKCMCIPDTVIPCACWLHIVYILHLHNNNGITGLTCYHWKLCMRDSIFL